MNMTIMRKRASRIGSQAPSRNLISAAEKYRLSMEPKKRRNARANNGDLCQQRIITRDVRQVVTSITVMTASPVLQEQRKDTITEIYHNDNKMKET